MVRLYFYRRSSTKLCDLLCLSVLYVFSTRETEQVYGGPLIESEERAEHTASGTRPGLWIREALTAWRKSTTPSVLSLSN